MENQCNVPIQTGIGPMTDGIINYVLDKCKSDSVKQKFFDNIAETVNQKIQPYIYLGMAMYIIVIILLLLILLFVVKRHR